MISYLRHGETDANVQGLVCGGEWDIALNEKGRQQAAECAAEHDALLQNVDAVYVSPLLRARQTAEIVTANLDVPHIVIEDLGEWKLGEYARRPFADVPPFFTDLTLEPPGGETFTVFQGRVMAAIRDIHAKRHRHALIVAHGGVWFAYAKFKNFSDCSLQNCCLRPVEFS